MSHYWHKRKAEMDYGHFLCNDLLEVWDWPPVHACEPNNPPLLSIGYKLPHINLSNFIGHCQQIFSLCWGFRVKIFWYTDTLSISGRSQFIKPVNVSTNVEWEMAASHEKYPQRFLKRKYKPCIHRKSTRYNLDLSKIKQQWPTPKMVQSSMMPLMLVCASCRFGPVHICSPVPFLYDWPCAKPGHCPIQLSAGSGGNSNISR